jgi:hypothetical protein
MTIDRVSWDSFWVRRVALGGPSASEGMIYVSLDTRDNTLR